MKNMKKLIASVALTVFVAVSVIADCDPTAPGQIPTVPCSAAQPTSDESTDPGQTETPPAADSVDVVYVVEDTLIALLIF